MLTGWPITGRRSRIGLLASLVAMIASGPGSSVALSDTPDSYFPHWVTREGTITAAMMDKLPAGTIIGAHHEWGLATLRRILDYADKRFRISWYVESNVSESDDPTPVGTTVAARIAEAAGKQRTLVAHYGAERFVNLFELNGSRDKKDGNLSGRGNTPADWLKDAAAVKAAGFSLIAKSPAPAHVDELRSRFGAQFVPRIVFEDVTAGARAENPGYRAEARALSRNGETVTLVIHSGAYGGFPATSLTRARSVIRSDFDNPRTEAIYGRPTAAGGFEYVKRFGSGEGAAEARSE